MWPVLGGSLVLTMAACYWWRWRIGGPPHPSLGDHEEYRRWRVAPRPFAWRWLMPVLTGGKSRAWRVAATVALVASGPALALYLLSMGASAWQALAGVGLWICLPGVWERHAFVLYLADAPALVFAMVAACPWLDWPWRVTAALLAGATRETAPLLAAAFGWSLLPLVGLLAVPWWRQGKPWRNRELYQHPWRRHAAQHRAQGFDLAQHVGPFGGAIPGLVTADLRVWLAVVIAAFPVLRSVDTARLLVQASPAVIASAVVGASDGALCGMLALGLVLSSHWRP